LNASHSRVAANAFLPYQQLSLGMRFPVVTITLGDVLPVSIVRAVQSIHHKSACSYPAHLFIDVLAKVRYIKYTIAVVQVRVHQV
jgi:hypothetical protein